MAIEYAPLFALETQFQTKDGRNNTGGWLKVFLAATDDPAVTYSDYNYTQNPEKIILDGNGRAVVICDTSKAYRLEVYDMNGMLLWTEEPVFCSNASGGGNGSATRVISTDGSIAVNESTGGSTTTYDIGIAPSDSVEFLEWGAALRDNIHDGGILPITLSSGSMEMGQRGPKLLKDHYYHITNWMTVVPLGTGRNYETLTVTLHVTDSNGGHSILIRDFDIDTSLSDSVTHEFATDFLATEDCEIFWELSNNISNIGTITQLGANIHRVYSGINAVPGTCATKQWVSESYQPLSGMGSYQPVSAMSDYATEQYVDSAVSSKLDTSAFASASAGFAPTGDYAYNSSLSAYYPASASGVFQLSGQYQTAGDYAFNSSVSSKLDASASSNFAMNSAMTSWIPYSALDYSGTAISGIGGSSLAGMGGGGDYTGVYPVSVDNTTREISVDSMPLMTDSSMTAYASGDSSVIGVNMGILSGKLDASASSDFYPMTGNPSGFLTTHQSLTGYATETYVDSAVSGKLDTSAYDSSQFYSTSNPSGFITGMDLSPYQTTAGMTAYQPAGDYQPSGDYIYVSALGWAEVN